MAVEVKSGRFVTDQQVAAAGEQLKITEVSTEEAVVDVETPNKSKIAPATTHRYPIDNNSTRRYGASVSFRAIEIIPPGPTEEGQKSFLDFLKNSANFERESKLAKSIAADKNYDAETAGKSKEEALREAETSSAKEMEKAQRQHREENPQLYRDRGWDYEGRNIKLYLPIAFQQNDSFNIATPELGQVGAAAAAAASSGKGMLSAGVSAISAGANSIIDLVSGRLAGDAARLGAAKLASKVPIFGTELGQAAEIAGAVTVNPNIRSAFRGVGLREFSFTFKFIARSQTEANMVESIINTFRERAYPESIELGGISGGYRYPNMFEIVVRHESPNGAGRRIGNKMKHCFLRSIATSYNSSSMAFHADGQPVEIDLSLNFVEEVTLTRADIKEGF